MKDFLELGKSLFLLFIIFLVLLFVSREINLEKPVAKKELELSVSTSSVVRVVDGDTIVINGGKSVRLLGIDAEEYNDFCYDVARDRLKELVLNKEVVLKRELRDADVYGRLLRYVFVGEQNIDLELIKEGLVSARASWEGGLYDKQFAEAEYAARSAKIGCKWANK